MMNPTVELHFPISATKLPSDHSYAVYAAISSVLPEIHKAEWLGIHTIRGRKTTPGEIKLSAFPTLRLRLPSDKIPLLLPLAGKKLEVHGNAFKVGIPQVHSLSPAKTLRARLVTIKLADPKSEPCEISAFISAINRRLEEMSVRAEVELEAAKYHAELDPYARRTLRIKGTTITGYGVILRNLSDEDSIKVQEQGIGGRRKLGCGLFMPAEKSIS